MGLAVGTRLGPYEILAPIGAGGMGEVYRARDTKLDRDVAIKVLPSGLAQEPERLARFEREAKVLAALNHPNIAQIYGVEQGALVMELVEGENLSGPIPVPIALDYARQIADALEAAHEKGIVHRDLKPANIKVTPQGVVKVLDFGLAVVAQPAASRANASISPTLTLAASEMGVLLGTAGYMSPEQAAGKPVDKRADIWAFGVVLWELLTGRRLFDGETISHTLAAVLTKDVDWTHLPAGTPSGVRALLRQCLARDLRRRLPDMGAARLNLEDAIAGHASDAPAPILPPRPAKLPWMVASIFGLALIAASVAYWQATRTVERPLTRLNVDLGPDAEAGLHITAALSPDGRRLVFPVRVSGTTQLATRLLDQATPTVLAGTVGAADPFFSPDGQWIGFSADSKLKKISVLGGAAVTLCDAPTLRGASWGKDGNIIAALGTRTGLSRVPAAGGMPQPLTKPEDKGQQTQRWPQILPDGGAVLFMGSVGAAQFDDAEIDVLSLKTGAVKTLLRGGYFPRYLPTGRSKGHLVYAHEGVLFGVSFDPARLELLGTPAPLLEDLAGDPNSGGGQFDFSEGAPSGPGTFVYGSGKSSTYFPVWWLDSSGQTKPLAPAGIYYTPSLSPDGKLLALAMQVEKGVDIHVYDWQRGAMSRLTFDGRGNVHPIWTPDGKHIVYNSGGMGGGSIGWVRADGAGEAQLLLESKSAWPSSFSPDGRRLAYAEQGIKTALDILTVPVDLSDPEHPKTGKPEVLLATPAIEVQPIFSHDGRWIAYVSTETGKPEVYVRPFPGPGKRQISSGGGSYPFWSRNGRDLFFMTQDQHIMVVPFSVNGESFVNEKPRLWSEVRVGVTPPGDNPLTFAPDDKRFAVFPNATLNDEKQGNLHVTFLLNFFDEVRRRIPEAK